ncbi:MAG TPA: alkaline phosphatase family protein [Actinospica sp.]|jgi:hypothetical protein|nr:alkaline phosphatase family protein [Actinospica sp.]
MPYRSARLRYASLVTAALFGGSLAFAAPASASPAAAGHSGGARGGRHVLLISVDGLHQSDLTWYVRTHPHSYLAELVHGGIDYTDAETTNPSDSFPGMVAQLTGGTAAETGVYYDDTYNHALLPAGTTDCANAAPGAEVDLTEDLDLNKSSIDAGQGLPGLPGSILSMTGDPLTLINPAKLPVDPATCKPITTYSYLKVNTVFDVAKQAGLRTAWSDKHAAYSILDGASGDSIDDLFTPEINSDATGYAAGDDWTSDNAATMQYDTYKVDAILNEINGYDHSGAEHVGTPGIFGMNFQTVSTAQKLPTSDGLTGGYEADGVTPGPLLTRALDYVDAQAGRMIRQIGKDGLAGSTTIILSAKHGQSPTLPSALTRIDDGPIIGAVNAAWAKLHPSAKPLVSFSVDDDAMLWWLSDRSQAAADFAKKFLLSYTGVGDNIQDKAKPFTSSGLKAVYAGAAAKQYFGASPSDPRTPDLVGVAQYGTVYTGGTAKIAEHGGANPADRDVPIVVSGAGIDADGSHLNGQAVYTTQIAPTILELLGLNPQKLQAVRDQHTQVLPDLR